MQALQRKRLHALLSHATMHIPYYRKVLREASVADGSGRVNLNKFDSIPLLDKSILRKQFEELKSDDLGKTRWKHETSGGSTGEPVRFVQDQQFEDWNVAFKMLGDSWSGYESKRPKVVLWGSERDLFQGGESLRVRLGRWLQNAIWLNAFRMTPEQMEQYVACINRTRPSQILAYVESIYELARFVESRGLNVFSPCAIMTAAGTLHEPMREVIERVFGAPVFNHYGSREAGGIASECKQHKGLHVSVLTHHVEILRSDGSSSAPGEIGEVVLTPLTNYAMPLIRYRIGDMAAWAEEPCSCGRSWPLFKTVSGRVTDTFVRADGTLVHGEYFTHLFYFRDWVKKFQVVQEQYDVIQVNIVLYNGNEKIANTRKEEIQDIESKIAVTMGSSCKIRWNLLSDIPHTASGKYRYTISKVSGRRPPSSL
jgi:phenylacetate-CoA ligase